MRSRFHNSDRVSLVIVLAVIAVLFAVIALAGTTNPLVADPASAPRTTTGTTLAAGAGNGVEAMSGLMSGDVREVKGAS